MVPRVWAHKAKRPLEAMPGTGVTSFLPHSVGQSKAWSQRRFKADGGVGGGTCLLIGRAAQSQCKSYGDREVENGAGHGSISVPCS